LPKVKRSCLDTKLFVVALQVVSKPFVALPFSTMHRLERDHDLKTTMGRAICDIDQLLSFGGRRTSLAAAHKLIPELLRQRRANLTTQVLGEINGVGQLLFELLGLSLPPSVLFRSLPASLLDASPGVGENPL
jgi:hypothetical protein